MTSTPVSHHHHGDRRGPSVALGRDVLPVESGSAGVLDAAVLPARPDPLDTPDVTVLSGGSDRVGTRHVVRAASGDGLLVGPMVRLASAALVWPCRWPTGSRRRPLRTRRADHHRPGPDPRHRIRHAPRTIRPQAAPATGPARPGLDQPPRGHLHGEGGDDAVVSQETCLTKLDMFRIGPPALRAGVPRGTVAQVPCLSAPSTVMS